MFSVGKCSRANYYKYLVKLNFKLNLTNLNSLEWYANRCFIVIISDESSITLSKSSHSFFDKKFNLSY